MTKKWSPQINAIAINEAFLKGLKSKIEKNSLSKNRNGVFRFLENPQGWVFNKYEIKK